MPQAINVLVGAIAGLVSIGAMAAAFELWQWPYGLRTVQRIEVAKGRLLARCYLLFVCFLMAVAAVAILTGMRPRFGSASVSLGKKL